ncbi:hypothetical protein R70199_07720 [Paraburkholderia domus]|nr:hypothetical protein R70199_07720 [Paraburkholderia domus]
MGGSHRDTKGKGRRERQPFLKPSGVEWRGEKKSTDLGRNVWRSMRKSAGNETSVATGMGVLRQKHPDFEPAFSESALQRAKKSQPEGRQIMFVVPGWITNLRETSFYRAHAA